MSLLKYNIKLPHHHIYNKITYHHVYNTITQYCYDSIHTVIRLERLLIYDTILPIHHVDNTITKLKKNYYNVDYSVRNAKGTSQALYN